MNQFLHNSYRITVRKDYVESLLKDLVAAGAIDISPLDDEAEIVKTETVRREKHAEESRWADEKFKKFLEGAG